MTATNHVLTGSVFALATATVLPWWAILPMAFLLHFVLDSLPHFGEKNKAKHSLDRLKWLLPMDALVGGSILLVLLILRPEFWLLAIAGGIACASPDLWSAKRFFRYIKTGDPSRSKDWFSRFHGGIQWGERLWGVWIEAAWFAVFFFILVTRL